MKKDTELIKQLKELITKGNAHPPLWRAVDNIPELLRGVVPEELPYSIWQLVEHIRIAQWDILEFSRNPKHVSPKWPEAYWPEERKPSTDEDWHNSIEQIRGHQAEFIALLEDESADLYKPFPHGNGQNLLREALVIADHNSYHTAEIIMIRRLLGNWK